jgi:hypothetical protein
VLRPTLELVLVAAHGTATVVDGAQRSAGEPQGRDRGIDIAKLLQTWFDEDGAGGALARTPMLCSSRPARNRATMISTDAVIVSQQALRRPARIRPIGVVECRIPQPRNAA